MNEELRKKYGEMTKDDMIVKMEEQEMIIKKKDKRINELGDNLTHLNGRIKGFEERVADAAVTLVHKDNRIKDLEHRLDVTDRTITSYQSEVKELREKNEELAKSVEERDETIEICQTGYNRLHDKNLELENELDEANDEIGELDAKLSERGAINRELEERIEKLQEMVAELGCKYPNDTDTRITNNNLKGNLDYWNRRALVFEKELADAENRIKDIKSENDELLKNLGEASKEVEEKRTRIIELENEVREKNNALDVLRQNHADLFDGNVRLMSDIQNLKHRLETVLPTPEGIEKQLECCKKMHGLDGNADCPAYAARMKAKYDSLIKAGFTEEQTMSLIPMWTDE